MPRRIRKGGVILIVISLSINLTAQYFIIRDNGPIWVQIIDNFSRKKPVRIYSLDTLKNNDSIIVVKKEAFMITELDCADALIDYYEGKKQDIECDNSHYLPYKIPLRARHQLIGYTKDSLFARVRTIYDHYSMKKHLTDERRGYVYYKTIHPK